jgi:hypothetical protein
MSGILVLAFSGSLFLAVCGSALSQTKPPAPTSPSGSSESVPLTVDSVPRTLLYHLFFGELAAAQKRVQELKAAKRDGSRLETFYRQLVGLNYAQYVALVELSVVLMQETRGHPRQEVEEITSKAIKELHDRLGWQGFALLDVRIRNHVVPRLRAIETPGVAGKQRQEER